MTIAFVNTIAMPRPATKRISVAMMGCMRTRDTSIPFHIPAAVHTSNAPIIATAMGYFGWPARSPPMRIATAPADTATTEPTEMSIPCVAMTSVMPMDSSMIGATFFRISIRLPYRCPSLISRRKKWGVKNRVKSKRTPRAMSGHTILVRLKDLQDVTLVPSRDRPHDAVLVHVLSVQFRDLCLVFQDGDPAAAADHFFELGGNEHDAHPLPAQVQDKLHDLQLGSDIDAARRLIQYQYDWTGGKPPRQHHFLLVASAELAGPVVRARGHDCQRLDHFIRDLQLLSRRDELENSILRLQGQDDVFPDSEVREDALVLPVFRAEPHPGQHRALG